ncbi:MAG: hypothetical protein IJ570_00825 [Prevotella sp.]|nr:hypothetical protein [Prevotella sp.]
MYNTEYIPQWEQYTRNIFWSVALTNLIGFVSTIFFLIHILPLAATLVGSSFSHNTSAAEAELSQFGAVFLLMKALVLAGYVGYIMGLSRFASIQPDEEGAQAVSRVRTGLIVVCTTSVLYYFLPWLMQAADATLFLVVCLALWVADIVGYSLMMVGYKRLKQSPYYNEKAAQGAENLRYAALCGIRLVVLPVVTLCIVVLILFMTYHSAQSSAMEMQLTGANLSSLDSFTGTIAQIASLFRTGGLLLVLVAITAAVLAACWGFAALAKPILGWSCIRSGYLVEPAEETETEETETEE